MFATLVRIEPVAANIESFWFRPEQPFEFIAGQFTELHLPHANADNRGERRWFTISSPPTGELFSITTKFADTRSSSFKKALRQLAIGTRLHFAEPMGDFVLPKDPRIPLIFVAAGMGITPVHSMVRFLEDTRDQRTIQLLYNTRTQKELAFEDIFKGYPLAYTPVLSRPDSLWLGEQGHVTAERIMGVITTMPEALVYLTGSEYMVEQLYAELPQKGLEPSRIIVDFFHGYRDI